MLSSRRILAPPGAAEESRCLMANVVRDPRVILPAKVPVIKPHRTRGSANTTCWRHSRARWTQESNCNPAWFRHVQSECGHCGDGGRPSGGPDPRGLLTKVCPGSWGAMDLRGPAETGLSALTPDTLPTCRGNRRAPHPGQSL